jgi:MFS family permease
VGIWLTVLVPYYGAWITGTVLQGAGTAMVYPTLLAAIADHAYPSWRASSLGVYRFWRDLGSAIGALMSGMVADAISVGEAIQLVAAITFASGLVTLGVMSALRSMLAAETAGIPQQKTERRRI